jgi:hypothetical protein
MGMGNIAHACRCISNIAYVKIGGIAVPFMEIKQYPE